MIIEKTSIIEDYFDKNISKFFWVGILQSFSTLKVLKEYHCYDGNFTLIDKVLKIDDIHDMEMELLEKHRTDSLDQIHEDYNHCFSIHNAQLSALVSIMHGVNIGLFFQVFVILGIIMFSFIEFYLENLNTFTISFIFMIIIFYSLVVYSLARYRTKIVNKILG